MSDTQLMNAQEHTLLGECENIIEKGITTFVEVGRALCRIRDEKLYRENHITFEKYCKDRWKMTRPRAYQMIEGAAVIENLSTIVDKLPSTESQTRPLTRLDTPEEQQEAWADASSSAESEGRAVTAADVETAVEKIKPHVAQASGNFEWFTPPVILDAAREAMGTLDCDPASSETANKTVRARTFFTKEQDGLSQKWHGNVWLNPPFSQPEVSQFCGAICDRILSKEIKQACVLTNNATETIWGQRLLYEASAVCFPAGRVRFLDPQGNLRTGALQGQMVCYFGENPTGFADAFNKIGVCFKA